MIQVLSAVAGPIVTGIGKLFGNRERREEHSARFDMGAQQQFAAEFLQRDDTWWGSLVNGLNRLPRPLTWFWVFWMVAIWPAADMAAWSEYLDKLAKAPEGLWALFGIVITFYFGGRMQTKFGDFKVKSKLADLLANRGAAPIAPTEGPPPRIEPPDWNSW